MKLSAVIITLNEEKMLEDCLKSLKFCDEILVVDNGSTDDTLKIAKNQGARVVKYPGGTTFAKRRNKGAKEAKGNWILYVDADERVTKDLADEIMSTIKVPEYGAYAIPRKNIILGKEFKHGGFGGYDYVKRLFKKESLMRWEGDLHEEPVIEGELGFLKNKLTHVKHEDFSEMIEKTNKWSDIEAKLMYEADHPPMTVLRFLSAMFREFWFRMVKKRAFLDGKEGIIFALYQVYSRFISYAKLWEMQITKK